MADKPARGLIIYGDGVMSSLSPSHSHIHNFASLAVCGFLAVRDSSSLEKEDDREVRELAQLLDVPYAQKNKHEQDKVCMSTISERLMGMRAAFCSNCSSTRSFARDAGFTVFNFDELMKVGAGPSVDQEIQDASEVLPLVSKLLRMLGFHDGNVVDDNEYDLVFLHIKHLGEVITSTHTDEIELINALVGGVVRKGQDTKTISSRLHLSLILSYGTLNTSASDDDITLLSTMKFSGKLSRLYPCQSYEMKEGRIVKNVRHHHPMLVAQWQEAVTRRDRVTKFDFEEFHKNGGNLAILAERFLYEVAFKMWKAPKYGA